MTLYSQKQAATAAAAAQNQHTPTKALGNVSCGLALNRFFKINPSIVFVTVFTYLVEFLTLGFILNIPKINIIQNQQEIGEGISSGPDEYVQSASSNRKM